MSLIQQFLKGNRETDEMEPGLIQKADATVWLVNPDGSETQIGGATDEVVQINVTDFQPALLPIVAVDLDAQTLEVVGDQTAVAVPLALVPNGAGFVISGSTGNDGNYANSSATYDPATNRTTLVIDTDVASLSDPTADGNVQLGIVFIAEITVPANGAVEWVLIDTTVEWADTGFYLVVGDTEDPEGFVGGVQFEPNGGLSAQSVGRWQWPVNTLDSARSNPVVAYGNYPGYRLYPDGGTVKIVATQQPGGSSGATTVVVHHHFTEPVMATRIPQA